MKNKNPLNSRVLNVLAACAVLPQIQQATPNKAAQRNAPTVVTRAAPGTNREALPAPTQQGGGQVIALIGGRLDQIVTSRAGMDRKTWGMSSRCKKMRLKNVRNGFQPHYRPRATA